MWNNLQASFSYTSALYDFAEPPDYEEEDDEVEETEDDDEDLDVLPPVMG